MLTCRRLLHLDSFKGIKLVAGREGLDNPISWPYPKHTKSVTPWVKNGEFLMVSGFELGVNEQELLGLLEEASANKLSGILVEGGINFKEISLSVKEAANQLSIPLFFAPSVVSFLDITREISSLILEEELIQKHNTSLLDKLLKPNTFTQQEAAQLLEDVGISAHQLFVLARVTISRNTSNSLSHSHPTEPVEKTVLNEFGKMCSLSLHKSGIQTHELNGLYARTYLLYAPDNEVLLRLQEVLIQVRNQMEILHHDCPLVLSFSNSVKEPLQLYHAFLEVGYTNTLVENHLIPGPVQKFADTGGYQLLFHITDKEFLMQFRDHYLKELYLADQTSSSQLLKTLKLFLLNSGNTLRTAEQLFTHRNTLQYRMDRIKSITGQNMNEASVRRDFMNAFMILDLYPFASSSDSSSPST